MNDLSHAEAHERIADLALEPRALASLADAVAGRALDASENEPGPFATDLTDLLGHVADCGACRTDIEGWVATYAALDAATAGDTTDAPTTLGALASEPALAAPAHLRGAIATAIHGAPMDAARGAAAEGPAAAPIAEAPAIADPLGASEVDPGAHPVIPPDRDERPRPIGGVRGRRFSPSFGIATRRLLPLVAVLAVVAGSVAVVRDQSSKLEASRQETAALRDVATVLGRLVVDPTHHVEALTAADGSARGTLAWSKHDLVVMTAALTAPPAGSEYRCWVERDGKRTKVGTMWFAGDLAYWNGSLDEWATVSLDGGGTFGVSLETVGAGGGGTPVLEATLPG